MNKITSFFVGMLVIGIIAGYFVYAALRAPRNASPDNRFVAMPDIFTGSGGFTKLMKGLKLYGQGNTVPSAQDVGRNNPFEKF